MNRQAGKVPLIITFIVLLLLGAVAGFFLLGKQKSSEPIISSDKTSQAINLLKEVAEIKIIEDAVVKSGRKLFYTNEGENGDIITVSLRESFPDDPHTTRIDTFNLNINTKVITVSDYATDKDISLEEWKKTVKERFE